MIDTIELWRIGGAALGSAVALFGHRAKTRQEFFTRFFVSTIIGAVCAPLLREYFGKPEFPRFALIFGGIGGAFGWYAYFAVVRILNGTNSLSGFMKPTKKD